MPKTKAQKAKKQVLKKVEHAVAKKITGQGRYKGVTGRGDYKGVINSIADNLVVGKKSEGQVNKLARMGGEMLGKVIPIPGASHVLGNASSWLSRVFGFGDYEIEKNALASDKYMNISTQGGPDNIPEFKGAKDDSILITHREFIQDVIPTIAGFQVQNFLINAGNPLLWPWLSNIAQNFEEAEIMGLIFEYKPTCASAVSSATIGMGTVIMATDYDVVDSNFPSKRAMEITEFSSSGQPYFPQIHPVECDPKQNVLARHFVQYGASTVAQFPDDPRFGCLGNFQIATSGIPVLNQAIGELWVSYRVKLLKPTLPPQLFASLPSAHATFTMSTGGVPSSLVQRTFPSGGPITVTTLGTVNPTINIAMNQSGQYLVLMGGNSSGTVQHINTATQFLTNATLPLLANLDTLNATYQGIGTCAVTALTTSCTAQIIQFNGNALTFSGANLPVNYTTDLQMTFDIFILPMNSLLTSPVIRNTKSKIRDLEQKVQKLLALAGDGKAEKSEDDNNSTCDDASSSSSCSSQRRFASSDLKFPSEKIKLLLKGAGLDTGDEEPECIKIDVESTNKEYLEFLALKRDQTRR